MPRLPSVEAGEFRFRSPHEMKAALLSGRMPEATPAPSPDPADPRGTPPSAKPRIPDYELLRIIGRGSYGDVWLARGVTGLYRAVKLVWRDRFSDPQPYEREFKGLREFATVSITEARQLALLHVGRNDEAGFFYYVMELADDIEKGREILPDTYVPHTLKEVQQRRGRQLAPQVVALGVDLARALAGLHAHGLVHRDVKPSNVIVVGGAPKLADIGLVTAATAAHTFVGTEGFVPPEGPGTPAADVFSLGKLLYEIATGLDRHDYPRLPADFNTLPDRKELLELNEIIIRACDPAATQRYADATALLDDLLLLQAGRSMRRLRAAERRLTRAVRIGTVLALVAGIAGAGAYVERQRAESENTLRRQAEAERDDLARHTIYAAGLARTQRALELADLGRARQQLRELYPKAGEPDLRGFEWYALWSEAQGDAADVLRDSGPAAEKVRFSPDGKLIAAHSADKRITLWDTATKQLGRTIDGVHRFAGFSADGQWLIGSDPAYGLQRWRTADGTPDTQPAAGINRPIAALGADRALSFVDGSAGQPHTLRLWDFSRHAEAASIALGSDATGARWDFYRAVTSADGRVCALLLVSGREHLARWKFHVVDLEQRRVILDEPAPDRPSAIALSANGVRLAVASTLTLEVQVRDLTKKDAGWSAIVGSGAINVLAFSPDDTLLAAAGRDQIVRVLESGTGKPAGELRGHNGGIEDLAWSPTDPRLVSTGNGGDVRWWHDSARASTRLAAGFWVPPAGGGTFCASNDGRRIAVSRNAEQVDILNLDTLEVALSLPRTARPAAFVDGGTALLSMASDGRLQRWSLGASPAMQDDTSLFESKDASTAVVSRDGRVVAASNALGQLTFLDRTTGRRVPAFQAHRDRIWLTVLSPDGSRAITSGADNRTCVWQTSDGAPIMEWPSRTSVLDAAFDDTGGQVAFGLSSGDIELRDGRTFAPVRTLRSGSARIVTVAFSPDGRRLAAGGPAGAVHIYATDHWSETTTLLATGTTGAGNAYVTDLAFAPGGDALLAYLVDGRVRVWRTKN